MQIGGHEGDDARAAEKAREPDRPAVHLEALPRPRRRPRDRAAQANLARRDPRLAADVRPLRPGANQFAFAMRAKRLPRRQHRERFEQIRLPLRVRSDEDVESGLRREIEALVIAEVGKPQLFEAHATSGVSSNAENGVLLAQRHQDVELLAGFFAELERTDRRR